MAVLLNFKSSEVGTLRRGSLQRSSVQPTRVISESKSNVNISFFTLRNIFIWLCIWNPDHLDEKRCYGMYRYIPVYTGIYWYIPKSRLSYLV